MSDSKLTLIHEYNIAGNKWRAECDATRMRKDSAICPLCKMICMPGIQYSVTNMCPHNNLTVVDMVVNTQENTHPLLITELNMHLYNVLHHICNMCPYNANKTKAK